MPSGTSRLRTWHALVAGAIVLLALCLRLTGIDRQLPHRPEPDAFFVQAYQDYEDDPALIHNAHYLTRYPSLVPRLFSLLPYPERPARASGPGSEAVHLAAVSWPHIRVRTGIALVSTLGVAVLWFLARRFLSPMGALTATFFLATSLLSILFAQQGRPHTPQAAMALAAVLAALRVLDRPNLGRIAAASLVAALAAACLQNGLLAFVPLFAAVFLGRREARAQLPKQEPGNRTGDFVLPIATAALAVLGAAAIALPFYPGLPYVDSSGLHLGAPQTGAYRLDFHVMHAVTLAGLRAAVRMIWAHDPLLIVLGLAGALGGIVFLVRRGTSLPRRRWLELLVLGSYVVPYLAFIAPRPLAHERYLLPMLPYLALLAAWVVVGLAAILRGQPVWWAPRGGSSALRPGSSAVRADSSALRADSSALRADLSALRAGAAALVVALCLAPPAYIAIEYGRVARAPDQLELAASWIRKNVDPSSRIVASTGTVVPLLYDPEFVRIDLEDPGTYTLPWLAYQGILPDAPDPERRWRVRFFPAALAIGPRMMAPELVEGWLVDSGADYVVMEASRFMRNMPATAALEVAAARLGERVYHSTGQMPSVAGLGSGEYQGASAFAFWLPSAKSFGPEIDIYRIRHDR